MMWTGIIIVAIVISPAWVAIIAGSLREYRLKALKYAAAPADAQATQELLETARRLDQRVGYLERILDTEAPGWRGRGDVR